MPVPVPIVSHTPAHPVIKPTTVTRDRPLSIQPHSPRRSIAFQSVLHNLPRHPEGPPAGFGTREEWLESLPSWRRNKSRQRSQEKVDNTQPAAPVNFQHDPTERSAAAGRLPEAYPLSIGDSETMRTSFIEQRPPTLVKNRFPDRPGYVADLEMVQPCDHPPRLIASNPFPQNSDTHGHPLGCYPTDPFSAMLEDLDDSRTYHDKKGAFSPVREDEYASPQNMFHASSIPTQVMDSSPAVQIHQNTTPFADYVDKAIATHPVQVSVQNGSKSNDGVPRDPQQAASDPVMNPAAIRAYRKMADPMADWLAEYIWKVCTVGLGLPARFIGESYGNRYSSHPPSSLSRLIQTLLYATLLQPSGIVLALWYIARLPVCFDWRNESPLHGAEQSFRKELFGEGPQGQQLLGDGHDAPEHSAPFRLVLLGFMLANKWLDDHTFSNKTWHTISEVPIRSINSLEFWALTILDHDLSVPPRAWDQWLSHLRSYHDSMSRYPLPIGRPSPADSKYLVRKMMEELIDLPVISGGFLVGSGSPSSRCHYEPVFVGLAGRVREKAVELQCPENDPLEIDLDEDGPLREEYLPRRRQSAISDACYLSQYDNIVDESPTEAGIAHQKRRDSTQTSLPPPAKWSPQADPRIERERDRSKSKYVAVQPFTMANDATLLSSFGSSQRALHQYAGLPVPISHANGPPGRDLLLLPPLNRDTRVSVIRQVPILPPVCCAQCPPQCPAIPQFLALPSSRFPHNVAHRRSQSQSCSDFDEIAYSECDPDYGQFHQRDVHPSAIEDILSSFPF
ncbi:hypothetical protein BD410DRAFT_22397 [Rickenella mellea]|uniref:Uncharacterized protein n=1 Tax=Rickenella mellea TaxID=50990 RepID=A0A4R5XEJ3_9AGAM|nr:hypothetical protein BD410DRAFT_22397 [Rickenella mellea]